MASRIWEYFGYPAEDESREAVYHASNKLCPYLQGVITESGV